MFKANLKKVTGTMVNIFVQDLTREANDKIHEERRHKRDERDPKRGQCKNEREEVQVGKLENVLHGLLFMILM